MKTYLNKKGTEIAGHICTCGKEHKWPGYVYAHWDIELRHTCPCGVQVLIQEGVVTPIKKSRKKRLGNARKKIL